jgi:tRNASer (uridine44-2'-O)-methyltransferase
MERLLRLIRQLLPFEYSSSIIRCDVLQDCENVEDAPHFDGYEITRTIHRRILPRKPSDGTLEQGCYFYESLEGDEGMLVMIPKLSSRDASSVPFYHPQVAGIAFRHRLCISAQMGTLTSDTTPDESAQYNLQMHYLPLEAPGIASIEAGQPYWAENSRTYRTALQLLTLLAKHGKSQTTSSQYVKRVHHDHIVPREEFQDLYVKLKEKYLWILDAWKEVTDPLKHVFEVGCSRFFEYNSVNILTSDFLARTWLLRASSSAYGGVCTRTLAPTRLAASWT